MAKLYKFKSEDSTVDEFGVDHKGFSLRDELEYNMMRAKEHMPKQQNNIVQRFGAFADLNRNYWDMKRDRTIGGDDYFHCKANYEAADRGDIGRGIAERWGNRKEDFDFWDNIIRKGLTAREAALDKIHDRNVNKIGRQRAQSGLYSNSREACSSFRVKDINEKY